MATSQMLRSAFFFEQERGLCYPCYEKNMIASLEMYDLYVLTGITLLALQDLSAFTEPSTDGSSPWFCQMTDI